jgi:hypothetical protein
VAFRPEVIPREDFARRYFAPHYESGQHVLFAGPTQMAGKTTLAFKLLEYCATPLRPAYVAVSKPSDKVSLKEGKRLGYRFVKTWPVPPDLSEVRGRKPSGYVVWPDFGDIDADAARASKVTGNLLRDLYAKGARSDQAKAKAGIIVLDDTVVKSQLLGLDRYMVTHIAMAGAMKVGGWYFVQKPTDAGRAAIWSYGNSAHKFLSHESDRRNRQRYDEISGFDSQLVARTCQELKPYQFLYLNNKGEMCIVDKDLRHD